MAAAQRPVIILIKLAAHPVVPIQQAIVLVVPIILVTAAAEVVKDVLLVAHRGLTKPDVPAEHTPALMAAAEQEPVAPLARLLPAQAAAVVLLMRFGITVTTDNKYMTIPSPTLPRLAFLHFTTTNTTLHAEDMVTKKISAAKNSHNNKAHSSPNVLYF